MENQFNENDHEDDIDREVRALMRKMEDGEEVRRTVIEMLVMLGSDAMLEHDM